MTWLYENISYFYGNYFIAYVYSINQIPGINPIYDYICHHAIRTQKVVTEQPYLVCAVVIADVVAALFIVVAVDCKLMECGVL